MKKAYWGNFLWLFSLVTLFLMNSSFVYAKQNPELILDEKKRVIISQNVVGGANILTQEMLSEPNTTYLIQYNFDLNNKTITIPFNSTLCFDGGSFDNGRIIGNNTYINAGVEKIFGKGLLLHGTYNNEVIYSEWYGSIGNNSNFDDSAPIQNAIDNSITSGIRVVQLLNKNYWIRQPINVHSFVKIKGIRNSKIFNYFTKLSVYSDIDAIVCNDADIKNLQIEDMEIVGKQGSKHGIHLYNDNRDVSLRYCNFINLTITKFNHGISIDIPGIDSYSALSYCNFDNVFCAYNNIGINFQGHFGENGHSKSVWMNCNRFLNCHFSFNSVGGVNIEGMKMCTNNIFDDCLIEGNGNDYDLSGYREYGVYGIRMYSKNYPNYGGNEVVNTYFEANYPRRKGTNPKKGEICSNGYCYPVDFLENADVANIIVENNQLDIENCISVNNKNVVMLANHGRSTLTNNFVYSLPLIKGLSSQRNFIETNDRLYASFVRCSHNTIQPAADVSIVYLHNNVSSPQKNSNYEFYKEDVFDGGPCEVKDGKYVSGTVFLKTDNTNTSVKMHMLTKSTAGTDLRQAYYTLKNSIDGNRTMKVEVLSDITSTYSSSETFDRNIKYPMMYLYSSDITKKTIDFSNTGNMPVVSDLTIENIVFKTGQVSLFSVNRSGLTLQFKNCEFVMDGDGAARLFNLFQHSCKIVFENCLFKKTASSSPLYFFYGSDKVNAPQISFSGCTIENVSICDYSINGYGPSEKRPTHGHIGDMYFDTTVNKPIYIKEVNNTGTGIVKWVDATGASM